MSGTLLLTRGGNPYRRWCSRAIYSIQHYILEDNLQTFPLEESREFDKAYDFKKLSIEGGAIKTIPLEIAEFDSLVSLIIKATALESVPSEIGSLVNLESLDLSGNKIITLPDEISQLTKLKEVNLSDNPINSDEAERIRSLLPQAQIIF